MASSSPGDKYTRARDRRDEHVAAVLSSASTKKLVVAGPGTGKTHLFKEILKDKPHSLTLTFINALVDDLSVDLSGLSDVRTLHSFARDLLRRLWKKEEICLFPRLSDVIHEDLMMLKGEDVDFATLFHNRDDGHPRLMFYKERKKYYDESYGYADIVFAAVKYLEANEDAIPAYDQVLVDEFQDFNALEVSLIDLLAKRSPVLIAGDDDQALYDFKHADPKHIRGLHSGADYENFVLPMCSRCPRVVVDATNDIVKSAVGRKLLAARITKPYEYFDDPTKDKISDQYPTLTHKTLFAAQFAWYIAKQLDILVDDLRERCSILIIAPTKSQARSVATALSERGFQSVDFVDRAEQDIVLFDGLKLLLADPKCNLGWRIIAGLSLDAATVAALLKKTEKGTDTPPSLIELIPDDLKKATKQALTALRAVRDGAMLSDHQLALLKSWGIDPLNVGIEKLCRDLNTDASMIVRPGLRKLPIKVTTVQGSKGLAADVVFITNLDDPLWISKGGITDKDVCNFLVALTRARKKVFLLSSQKTATPTFVAWIDPDRVTVE